MNKEIKRDTPDIDQIPVLSKTLDDMSIGLPVYHYGTRGTGKSRLDKTASFLFQGLNPKDKKKLPFVVVNCTQHTSPNEITGGQTLEGYQEGKLIEAWRDGKCLILEEMPRLDANTAGLLNDALASMNESDAIIFNGKSQPIKKHPDFACLASGNVKPYTVFSSNYVGNQQQDASLWDRFATSSYEIGFNETLEKALIYKVIHDQCVKIRNEVIEMEKDTGNDNHVISLRTMIGFKLIYELEMQRLLKDEEIPNAKTLEDAFECYFASMDQSKAEQIKSKVDMTSFYDSYKGGESVKTFETEFKRFNS